MKFSVLSSTDYRTMLWKNGGGTTHEIHRFPINNSDFDWRISMAEVNEDGDFSFFENYHRIITILSGNGIYLLENNKDHIIKKFDSFNFSGNSHIYCKLIDAPILDFNLIYNPKKYHVRFQWLFPKDLPHRITTSANHTLCFNASDKNCLININSEENINLLKENSLWIENIDIQKIYELSLVLKGPLILVELWNNYYI